MQPAGSVWTPVAGGGAAPGEAAAETDQQGYTIGVTLDKQQACTNEDVMVTVDATDPAGGREWLVPLIRFPGAGEYTRGFRTINRPGVAMWSSYNKPYDGNITVQIIDARQQRVVATRQVPLVINKCEDKPYAGLVLTCAMTQDDLDQARCSVRVRGKKPEDFVPVRFDWWVEDVHQDHFMARRDER